MNILVSDDDSAPGNLSQLEKDLSDAVRTSSSEGTPDIKSGGSSEEIDDGLPEKFRGKSAKEIADMYMNLESVHGRTANDLGVQRKLTDRLLQLDAPTKRETDLARNSPQRVEVTSGELLDKPTETLERFNQAREQALVKPVTDRIDNLERRMAETRFVGKHPDFQTVAASPTFHAWVNQSPIRLRAVNAAQQGNFDIADELLTEYKSIATKSVKEPTEQDNSESKNLDNARNASLESGGSVTTANERKAGKVYRRADLIALRMNKPEVYYEEGFQEQILKAYSEGRVK